MTTTEQTQAQGAFRGFLMVSTTWPQYLTSH